jgi:putative phage-type endonuclease
MYRDHGTYYELLCAQRSAGWHQERKGRVTASNFGTAAGHSEYKTRLELMREMAGLQKPKDFAFFQRRAMDLGVALEPYVRDWYEGEYKRKVIERGLVVPKWCMRIGVSVDGWIENPDDGKKRQQGIIEIKCPTNMYPQLVDHSHRIQKGEKFPEFYHLHIKPEHYDQMQGGMAILDADYCDYIVYVDKTKDIYPTRIMRDRKYWNEELYPKLLSFVVEMDEMIEKSKDDAVSPLTDQA